MNQSEGFLAKGQEKKLCKLVKSLYELKQAPMQRHQKFNQVIADFEFTVNEHDQFIYSKEINNDYLFLCLYVVDILIFETSLEAIFKIKDHLFQNFDIKNLRPADMILRMKISMDQRGISLSLSHSIEKMLHKFEFYYCKPISTSFDSSIH